MTTPLVSILCQTYNQQDYIAQCLDSLINQQCDFPYEILVHEDASPDGTAAIVRDYEARYPEIIKPIYQTVNQYNVGIVRKYQLPRVRGQYVAFCEGDDYWLDPGKLARQVAYLEAHPECSLLGENGQVLFTNDGHTEIFSTADEHDCTLEELLIERQFPSASVLFRARDIPAIMALKKGFFDTAMWGALSTRGIVHYSPVVSSVYRRGSGVTCGDPVKWANSVKWFDIVIKANFHVSLRARRLRGRGIFWCYYDAAKAEKKAGHLLESIKWVLRAVSYSPQTLVKEIWKKIINYCRCLIS